jgi:hypothetical protein
MKTTADLPSQGQPMTKVLFTDTGEVRDVEVTSKQSSKVLRSGGHVVDRGAPTYHLHGYNLERANTADYAFIAHKAPAL